MTQKQQTTSDKPAPHSKIFVGGVKATVWANTGENGRTSYAISVAKIFKGQDDQWHESNSYFPEDLPKLAIAATKAYESIHCRVSERQEEKSEGHVDNIKTGRTAKGRA